VVEISENRTMSKLPAMIVYRCSAIGTEGGEALILNFPPAMFSNLETRPAEANREP
jgi:hypothetical protein